MRSVLDDEQPSDRAKPEKIPHITSEVKRPRCQTLQALFQVFLKEAEGGTLSRSTTLVLLASFSGSRFAADQVKTHLQVPTRPLRNSPSAGDAFRDNKPLGYYLLMEPKLQNQMLL